MTIRSKINAAVNIILGPSFRRAVARQKSRTRERELRATVHQPDGKERRLPAIHLNGDFERSPLTKALLVAYERAIGGTVDLPAFVRGIEGMSGQRYRDLINTLIGLLPDARYLEVGSWAGSTATAALSGNMLTAVCIDNWSEFGGPRDAFLANTGRVITTAHKFRLIESDFRKVDYGDLGSFNVFLFDGPHSEEDQYDGVVIAAPALDNEFILIVDDWNWRAGRLGTFRAIRDCNWSIEVAIEIRTTLDESHAKVSDSASDWHNGYFIAVVNKR
ncbi:MAG: class I SAM-dependent methyltransferase [Pontixanthobacter sp.]